MTIEAYAKINLTLEVLGKRPDGYHALRSVVIPTTLSDTIRLEKASGVSSDFAGGDDLCVKAAKAILPPGKGVRIEIEKRIPSGGGLGGGSADAAAVLVALNEMHSLGKSVGELVEIAARVGSDVPSLVLARVCGPVLMEGRGEKVSPLGVAIPKPIHFVLANPGVHSSTKEVFAKCVPRVAEDEKILYNMRRALESGSARLLSEALSNDLEAPAMALHPEIARTAELLREKTGSRVAVTGSGATVFAVAESREAAREAARAMASKGAWALDADMYCPVV